MKKYTTDQVKGIFAEHNCKLLEREYKNMLTPMRYRCVCGGVSKIRLFSFLKGSRCQECGRQKNRQSHLLSFDVVKAVFEKEGYQVLATEYVDNKTPIEYVCDRGHKGATSYSNFRAGRRCKQCADEDMLGEGNHNYDPDRDAVEERRVFRRSCRTLVRRTLKLIHKDKTRRSEELLGYSHQDLKDRLLNHSGADAQWVIDHVFPIKAFVDYGIDDVAVINALENLRPLDTLVNLSKNDYYNKEDFETYLFLKGISCG